MSSQFPEEDERALQALFDETAEEPTQDQLNRMARAAAQVPDKKHAAKVKWWRPYVPWMTAAAGLAMAIALFVSASSVGEPDALPIAMTQDPSVEPTQVPSVEAPSEDDAELMAEVDALDLDQFDDFDEELDYSLASADVGHPGDMLDPLFLPEDDADFELIEAAYDEVAF